MTYIVLCKELFYFTALACQAWNGHSEVILIKCTSVVDLDLEVRQ